MITIRHAMKALAIALLLAACGLKAPLVLPPRTAPPAAVRTVPAELGGAPASPASGASRCPSDRPGSGDETECAPMPTSP